MSPTDVRLNDILDRFLLSRHLLDLLPRALLATGAKRASARVGQSRLGFGFTAEDAPEETREARAWRPVADWSDAERGAFFDGLAREYESLGFYLSASPLDLSLGAVARFANCTVGAVFRHRYGASLRIAGVLSSVEVRRGKGGRPYARFLLSDDTGSAACVAWADVVERRAAYLKNGAVVIVRAVAEKPPHEEELSEEERETLSVRLKVWDVTPIADAEKELSVALSVLFADGASLGNALPVLRSLLESSDGLGGLPVFCAVGDQPGQRLDGVRAIYGRTDRAVIASLPGCLGAEYVGVAPLS